MKVLAINGSPRAAGNTSLALAEMEKVFVSEDIEFECVRVGQAAVRGCIACGRCSQLNRCVFDDVVNEIAPKFEDAAGLVVASPVYYGSANATLVAVLDRLFYSTSFDKTGKVGAAISVARRGGLTATWDELNKYFGISGMPIASGQYWNGVHGRLPGEGAEDAEGMQQMRTLARNMVFLMRGVALARDAYGLPEREEPIFTNFVR